MYTDIKEQRGQYWLENIMKDKFAVSMFGQKRLSREGGIEIVVKNYAPEWHKMDVRLPATTDLVIMLVVQSMIIKLNMMESDRNLFQLLKEKVLQR